MMRHLFRGRYATLGLILGIVVALLVSACAPAPAPTPTPAPKPAAPAAQPTPAPKPAAPAPTAAPAKPAAPAPTAAPAKPAAPAATTAPTAAPKPAATAAAKPAGQIPLRVGIGVDTTYLPFYVADKKGLFAQNGIDLTLRTFPSGLPGCEAVAAGQFDMCQMADLSFAGPFSRGAPLKIVARTSNHVHLIRIAARKEIQKPADLKGKKLGFLAGSASEFVWNLYLKQYGISRDDVKWVNIQPPEAPALLDKGDIDAFFLWEPWPLRALKTSGDKVHILGTGGDANYADPLFAGVGDQYLRDQPEGVRRALKSLIDAVKYMEANPDESYKLGADVLKLTPEEVKELVTIGQSKYQIVLDQPAIDSLKLAAAFLLETKRIDKPLNLEPFFDPAPLRAVAPTAVTFTSLR